MITFLETWLHRFVFAYSAVMFILAYAIGGSAVVPCVATGIICMVVWLDIFAKHNRNKVEKSYAVRYTERKTIKE